MHDDGSHEYALIPENTHEPLRMLFELNMTALPPVSGFRPLFIQMGVSEQQLEQACLEESRRLWHPLPPPYRFRGALPQFGEHIYPVRYALALMTFDGDFLDMSVNEFVPYMNEALEQAIQEYSCSVPRNPEDLPHVTIML